MAHEAFTGTPGALNAQSTGFGWGGSWQVQNGSITVPGYNVASALPLTYTGLSQSGSYAVGGLGYQTSGRLLDTGSTGTFAPYLNGGLIGWSGQTLFGALMRRDVDCSDEISLTLHSGSQPWWVSSPGIAVGQFGGSGPRYWSIRLDGVVHQTGVPVVTGQAALLVVEISFGPTSTVNLFVNPPVGA